MPFHGDDASLSSMNMIHKYISLVFCALAFSLFAQQWTPFATVPEAEGPLSGCFLGDLIRVDGTAKPDCRSDIWIWTQGDQLHLRVELEEPAMAKIPMTVATRDGVVWDDDTVDIFLIKPNGQKYHFIYNAIGTQFDELNGDKSWNGDWTVSVKRELYAWKSDVVIDMKSLGGKPAEGTEWGFQIGRFRHIPNGEAFCWAPTKTERFKNAQGVIRFGNYNRPLNFVPGTEKSVHPSFVWKDDIVPQAVKSGTIDVGENLVHHFDFNDGDGVPLFRTHWVKRVSRVKAILGDVLAALEASTDDGDKALVADARTLIGVNCDQMPELCPLLEEEAYALRHRMDYSIYAKEMLRRKKPAEAVVYGVQNSLGRMRPVDAFSGTIGGEINLDAARNEMEAAQISLFGGVSPLIQVKARLAKPLVDEKGHAIPASAVRIRRIGQVMTCVPQYKVDYVGPTPDPLLPLDSFDVAAYGNETLWVDVVVPTGTCPGTYRGTILLKARNTDETPVPVTLRVRNFTMPASSSLVSAFGTHGGKVHSYNMDMWAIDEDMLQHRISPYTMARSPKLVKNPYLALTEADALEVTADSTGAGVLTLSLTDQDNKQISEARILSAGENHFQLEGLAERLPGKGLFRVHFQVSGVSGATLSALLKRGDGSVLELVAPTIRSVELQNDKVDRWPQWEYVAHGTTAVPAEVDWSGFDADMERALALGITSHEAKLRKPLEMWSAIYQEHLAQKGWLKYFYTYLADEPVPEAYPDINATLSPVKMAAGTAIQNMMTARSFPPELVFVDTWCPETYTYDPVKAAAEQAKNRNVWWYVAFGNRPPFPNIWIDSPIVETRVWLWQTWKHDLDGILYWCVNCWSRKDPWRSGETFRVSNGDGSLIYPDASGKPISSIRWEVLRDGMEDYELFCLLEAARDELGDTNPALSKRINSLLEVNPKVCVSWKEYTREAAPLLAERTRLMDCLEGCVEFLGHEPAILKRPRRRPGLSQEEIDSALSRYRESESARQAEIARTFQSKLDAVPAPSETPEEGLVLRYDFNQSMPFIYDVSGNHLHTGASGVEMVPGRHGQGIHVSAGKSLVLPGGSAILGERPEEGTVSFWLRPTYEPAWLNGKDIIPCIFYLMETDQNYTPSGYDEIGIYLQDGKLRARLGGTGITTPQMLFADIPNPLRVKEWTHIAITWKPGLRTLYLDGKEVASSTAEYTAPKLDGFAGTLGIHPCTRKEIRSCVGDYDDLRIYSRWLPPDEIQKLAE